MVKTKARRACLRWVAAALLFCGASLAGHGAEPETWILHLKNGDRLTGKMISEDKDSVVLSTRWNVTIHVPKTEIQTREHAPSSASPANVAAGSSSADHAAPPAKKAPAATRIVASKDKRAPAKQKPKEKKLDQWKVQFKLGTDVLAGANDRQSYYGQTTLTYTRNYKANPKQFLRNTLDYRLDYAQTDSRTTADRMFGGDKLDMDVGADFYGYNSARIGYDYPRRIALQYEVGPGLGYHAVNNKSFTMDAELGLNYQSRDGLDAPGRRVFQGRVGQELTWQIIPKLTFSQKFELLPFINDNGNYQIRVEGNLAVGLVDHTSLNLTVLNFYDSLPGPNVPRNEFQFRSALGVNF